jgi:hypothetical protein
VVAFGFISLNAGFVPLRPSHHAGFRVPQLLSQTLRRNRASAAGVGAEIGHGRESVNNWRNGDALPGRKARDKVLACARYPRLTETVRSRDRYFFFRHWKKHGVDAFHRPNQWFLLVDEQAAKLFAKTDALAERVLKVA